MSHIRVLQAVSGLEFAWQPGQVVEVTDEQAGAWADGVRAELVDPVKPVETTDEPPVETTDETTDETTSRGRRKPANQPKD